MEKTLCLTPLRHHDLNIIHCGRMGSKLPDYPPIRWLRIGAGSSKGDCTKETNINKKLKTNNTLTTAIAFVRDIFFDAPIVIKIKIKS
jgi:hypothetical protein